MTDSCSTAGDGGNLHRAEVVGIPLREHRIGASTPCRRPQGKQPFAVGLEGGVPVTQGQGAGVVEFVLGLVVQALFDPDASPPQRRVERLDGYVATPAA